MPLRGAWSLLLLVAGCSAASEPTPARGPGVGRAPVPGELGPALERWDRREARSRASAIAGGRRLAKTRSTRIGPPPPEDGPIVGRAEPIDVSFRDAALTNALRFLADAGGIPLVVEGGVSGSVTASLSRVRAYDALVAIAQAHGAVVRRSGSVVVVTVE